MAQPVFNAAGSTRGLQGGAAENVIVITSADLKQNGGNYSLMGGTPLPMKIVTGRRSKQGAATVVYPVDLDGNYDPSFAGYIHKVLNPDPESGYDPSSLMGFWPQNDLAGGVSIDPSGLGHDGAYTGVTLGQPGVPGMGMTVPFYDGANDYNNVYSVALATAFSGIAGTILVHAIVNGVGVWTDGITRYIVRLIADGTNVIYVLKSGVANRLTVQYTAGGVPEVIDIATTTIDWFTLGITWDFNAGLNGEVRAYFNGVQSGATATLLGVWAGVLAAFGALIGAGSAAPANVFHGLEGPVLLYTEAQPPAAMAYLSTP